MDSAEQQAEIAYLYTALDADARARCMLLAGFCIFVYDWFITLDDEVRHSLLAGEIRSSDASPRWSTSGRGSGRFRGRSSFW